MTGPGARRDDASAPWYDALGEGRLLLPRCPVGDFNRPDVLVCDLCHDPDLTWAEASGRGRVISRAVDHLADRTLVIVELAEGPWLMTRAEGATVAPGDQVVVRVVHPDEGEAYPIVVADQPNTC